MKIVYILIGLLVLSIILNKKYKNKIKNNTVTKENNNQTYPDIEQKRQEYYNDIKSNHIINYTKSYEPKYLMTTNEKAQYRKLLQWATKHNLIVFSKVRLLDLITPRKNQDNYKGALWKIQAKHIDYVICDQDIRVKCIVEINDNSHNRQDRADRDNFVSEVLQACGYKVLMTYNVSDEQLNNICGYTQPHKKQENNTAQ